RARPSAALWVLRGAHLQSSQLQYQRRGDLQQRLARGFRRRGKIAECDSVQHRRAAQIHHSRSWRTGQPNDRAERFRPSESYSTGRGNWNLPIRVRPTPHFLRFADPAVLDGITVRMPAPDLEDAVLLSARSEPTRHTAPP